MTLLKTDKPDKKITPSNPTPLHQLRKTIQQAKHLEFALVLLGFTALTLLMTWPAITLFGRGINAFGDVVVQMTTLTWDAHALVTNPLRIFEAPSFYPYAHT